ncbi:MAG: uroporphyrinogen decarboxylase family protein [candidate division KSB1 bacterium]|nr:uroporphyrinogen decarboxylase family protein [candidate division KSB1 bacterium]MDZ7386457.1 uroporphyrinogen decarboxylase family protein [candidate division KSB1 bacterium]
MTLTHVERFRRVMSFAPVDRLPMIEWAMWWDKTLARWYEEGLPRHLTDFTDINVFLGHDPYRQIWVSALGPDCPKPAYHGAPIARTREEYRRLKKHLFPDPPFDSRLVRSWAKPHARGQLVVWLTLDGFFWGPRELLGIEGHFLAFYDQPDLIHEINTDLVAFNLRVVRALCQILRPEYMTFAEDMSYNHGPMLSKAMFDEFLAPYYRQIVPLLKHYEIVPFVDSDGNVTDLIPWLEEVGIEGIAPLERMAGVDVAQIRQRHPRFKLIGAFDKMTLDKGPEAMRREFERLLPVMRQGGFIPSVDHQTPPNVSLQQYRQYMELLREYCLKAAS